MPTIGSIADIVDDVLGESRRGFTLLAEPGRFLAADCMTLFTGVVGTAERAGQLWHYLDDGLYGSYSNVMTENVHPPILALRELWAVGARNRGFRRGFGRRACARVGVRGGCPPPPPEGALAWVIESLRRPAQERS